MIGLKSKDRLEFEFLPAAMEIEETPPSPLGRWLIWILVSLFTAFIIWSCLGKVDEVATARGKVLPDGRTKVLQIMEEASIKAIYVEEGQQVREGQLLMEFDKTITTADVTGIEKELLIATIEKDMLTAELLNQPYKADAAKLMTEEHPDAMEVLHTQHKLREARDKEHASTLQAARLVVSQREQELLIEKATLESMKKTHLLDELEQSESGNGQSSKTDLLQKDNKVYQSQQEILSQEKKIVQAEDALSEVKHQVDTLIERRKHELLDKLVEKEKVLTNLNAELTKAEKRLDQQQLTSPVDGTVHGISTLTIGGVVSPAQAVISVVPSHISLVVEATISNQDIGFVKQGQQTFLKIDTFPFQKYGYLYGEILHVSPDAFDDEKLGPVYKAKVKINSSQTSMGMSIHLVPGMSLTTEVKTGQRRIIEFFLSPIIKYAEESLKLR